MTQSTNGNIGKMFLQLFHGRTNSEQDMQDWGEQGPIFGPLQFAHETYRSDVKMQYLDGAEVELRYAGDMVYYDGHYYGDWSTFIWNEKMTATTGMPDRVQPFDTAKARPVIVPTVNASQDDVTVRLSRNDLGQIVDGLKERADLYQRTARYHDGPESSRLPLHDIAEVSDADEARGIEAHYRAIINTLELARDAEASDVAAILRPDTGAHDPQVNLLASGYEFPCPQCETNNTLIAIPKFGTALECGSCHAKLTVGEAMDAND